MIRAVEQCLNVDIISGIAHESLAGWAGTRLGTRTVWHMMAIMCYRTEIKDEIKLHVFASWEILHVLIVVC